MSLPASLKTRPLLAFLLGYGIAVTVALVGYYIGSRRRPPDDEEQDELEDDQFHILRRMRSCKDDEEYTDVLSPRLPRIQPRVQTNVDIEEPADEEEPVAQPEAAVYYTSYSESEDDSSNNCHSSDVLSDNSAKTTGTFCVTTNRFVNMNQVPGEQSHMSFDDILNSPVVGRHRSVGMRTDMNYGDAVNMPLLEHQHESRQLQLSLSPGAIGQIGVAAGVVQYYDEDPEPTPGTTDVQGRTDDFFATYNTIVPPFKPNTGNTIVPSEDYKNDSD